MSRTRLRSRDVALLERLSYTPLEVGDIPKDSIERLLSLGLVRQVLGCCELTRAGQLMIHRQQFLRASGRRVARVTRSNPLFLQETRFFAPLSPSRLSDLLKVGKAGEAEDETEAPAGGGRQSATWIGRLGSDMAGRIRSMFQVPSGPGGAVRSKLNHEPR